MMATQKSIARRQVVFQENIEAQMGATSSVLENLSNGIGELMQALSALEELKKEVHEINLAVLRIERKLKGGNNEG